MFGRFDYKRMFTFFTHRVLPFAMSKIQLINLVSCIKLNSCFFGYFVLEIRIYIIFAVISSVKPTI